MYIMYTFSETSDLLSEKQFRDILSFVISAHRVIELWKYKIFEFYVCVLKHVILQSLKTIYVYF